MRLFSSITNSATSKVVKRSLHSDTGGDGALANRPHQAGNHDFGINGGAERGNA